MNQKLTYTVGNFSTPLHLLDGKNLDVEDKSYDASYYSNKKSDIILHDGL